MNRRRAFRVFGPALALSAFFLVGLDLLGLFTGAEHHGGFWNSIPLWDAGFGFAGGALLVFAAKLLVKPLLHRPEDYYAEPPPEAGSQSPFPDR